MSKECDGADGLLQPERGLPVPGVGLQTGALLMCAFSELRELASGGAVPDQSKCVASQE